MPRAAHRPTATRSFVVIARARGDRLCPPLVGAEIVRLLDLHEIESLERDELDDLDVIASVSFERLQFLIREGHELIAGVFVAFDYLALIQHLVVGGRVILCLMRTPCRESSILKRTCSDDAEVYSFTGIDTSPKEMTPEAIARTAMNVI